MRTVRLDSIEQYILQHGTVSYAELTSHFDVSLNTVRRDLRELENRGHVEKVYGGVKAVQNSSLLPMPVRSQLHIEGKQRIGELASVLVPDSCTIFLDSGSTTINILRHLGAKQGLSILTHSLAALTESVQLKEANIIALGGVYNAATNSFVGISTLDTIRTLSIDIAFMAATGVSIKNGLSNNTYFEAEIKRGIVNNSKKIVLMVDQSKFDHDALVSFCEMKRVSTVVTDAEPPRDYIDYFNENQIQLLY